MGTVLMKYYKYISDEMGIKGKVNLAKETKIPSTKAAMAPDSDENIAIFKTTIKEMTGKEAPVF